MKRCSTCGIKKSLSEFYWHSQHQTYRASCKECHSFYQRMYFYGLTIDKFEDMLDEQDDLCAICLKSFTSIKEVRIDHDRSCCPGRKSCGKCIRGLLCNRCNIGLSYYEDLSFTTAADKYLIRYKGER